MKRTVTVEDAKKAIALAVTRAITLVPPGRYVLGHEDEMATRVRVGNGIGVDARLMGVGRGVCGGVGYAYETEEAFHVGVRVYVSIVSPDEVKFSPSWASAPNDLVTALAASELHLATARLCARAQATVEDALRSCRGVLDGVWEDAMRKYMDEVDATREAFGNAWRGYRKIEDDSSAKEAGGQS